MVQFALALGILLGAELDTGRSSNMSGAASRVQCWVLVVASATAIVVFLATPSRLGATADGERVNPFAGLRDANTDCVPIAGVAISPDGRYIAAGSDAKACGREGIPPIYDVIHNASTGATVYRGLVYAISPDWRQFLDSKGQVRDLHSGKVIAKLAYRGALQAAGFSQDGKVIVTATHASKGFVLIAWDARRGQRLRDSGYFTLNASGDRTSLLGIDVISGSGIVRLAHDADRQPVIWDMARKKSQVLPGQLWAVSPDSRLGLTKTSRLAPSHSQPAGRSTSPALTCTAEIWDLARSRRISVLSDLGDARGAAFSDDGKILLTWHADNVKLWDTSSGQCTRTVRYQWFKEGIVCARLMGRRTSQLVVAIGAGEYWIDLDSGKAPIDPHYGQDVQLTGLDISQNGSRVVESFSNGMFRVRDRGKGGVSYIMPHERCPERIQRAVQEPGC